MSENDEEAHVCPICLEDSRYRDPITLPCSHVFCRQCVDNQLQRMTHNGDNMGRCAYCQQILFGDADEFFLQGGDEDVHPVDRIAAYGQCVVAVMDYPTGPNGENRLASAAAHNIGELYIMEYPDSEDVSLMAFPDLERARQNYERSIIYNPGNHDGLTMIGQCVYGLRHDDSDQEAIASARGWWSRALAMNPDDHIAIGKMALTHDLM